MKHTLTLFAILGLFAAQLFAQKAMPDVDVQTLDGTTINATEIKATNGPTVVAFWATWCAPCKKELDAYMEQYDTWKAEHGAEVYAVSIDGARQLKKVPPMVAAKGWTFPVLSDAEQQLQQALAFQSVPQVFVLDKDGQIVYSHAGYVPGDEAEVAEKLAELAQ